MNISPIFLVLDFYFFLFLFLLLLFIIFIFIFRKNLCQKMKNIFCTMSSHELAFVCHGRSWLALVEHFLYVFSQKPIVRICVSAMILFLSPFILWLVSLRTLRLCFAHMYTMDTATFSPRFACIFEIACILCFFSIILRSSSDLSKPISGLTLNIINFRWIIHGFQHFFMFKQLFHKGLIWMNLDYKKTITIDLFDFT